MTSHAANDLDNLYRAHSGWLLEWLSIRARCKVRAGDLMHETFSRLLEQPGLQFRSHPRRYLATVARRLLIDEARRRETERHFLEAFGLYMGSGVAPGADEIAEAVEQLTLLARLLGELPPRVRQAFLLSRVDGMTYAEIGSQLGVSPSMIKQYVARAFAHCYVAAHGRAD